MSTVYNKIFGAAALCTFAVLMACSSEETNHAGVLTETESGKTIAGLVTDIDGKALANVEVNLLQRNHVAARMAPVRKTYTHENGSFEIDSIEAGDFAIQMNDSVNFQSAYTTISITEEDADSNIELATTSLDENASVEIALSEFSLAVGDTFCLTGTINCATVDSTAISTGKLVLDGIPAAEFENASLLQGKEEIQEQDIDWSFKAGRTLYVQQIDSSKIVGKYTLQIPSKALDSLKHISAPHSLDSLIVPVKLASSFKNPSLMDDMGANITLVAVESGEDSTRYLAILPKVDTTSFEFAILENETAGSTPTIIAAQANTTPFDTIGKSDFWGAIELHNHSLGISFWVEADGEIVTDSNAFMLTSSSSDIGFGIAQCAPESKEVCTTLYNRVDTLVNDTVLLQKSKILDGERHHYSLAIKDKHVSIAIDGKTVRDTDLKLQTNFFMLPSIATGNFELENLTIYTLSNSIRHNNDKEWERLRAWQYAFYYIAEHEDSRSR